MFPKTTKAETNVFHLTLHFNNLEGVYETYSKNITFRIVCYACNVK